MPTATTAVGHRGRDLAALIKTANSCRFFMKLNIGHLDLNLTSEKVNVFYFQTYVHISSLNVDNTSIILFSILPINNF